MPADDVVASLIEAGVQTVVVKRGRLGARLTEASGTIDEPGIDVPVVDPVGAGDAFVAGFLSRMASGAPPGDCLQTAVLASAHAVTVQGDYEGMPEPADLAFLAGTERGVQR